MTAKLLCKLRRRRAGRATAAVVELNASSNLAICKSGTLAFEVPLLYVWSVKHLLKVLVQFGEVNELSL